MTITTNDTRDEYTATGGQTVFNYTFKIFTSTDLLVYQTASGATPDDTTDLITTYTVTGVGNASGGTIVLNSGATAGDKITIVSNISYERDTDYQFNGDFTADVVNDEQDRLLSLVKQVKDNSERTLLFSKSTQGATGKTLPTPAELADSVLAFDSNGDPVAGVSATDMQALIDAAEAVLANSNAGAVSFNNAPTDLLSTNVQDAIAELEIYQNLNITKTDNLVGLSGVAANNATLGTFTGTTIPDNRTIKQALQSLETAHEAYAVTSGSTTSGFSAVSGVTSVSHQRINWSRSGSVVSFSGTAVVDTSSTVAIFAITPPVASNFTNDMPIDALSGNDMDSSCTGTATIFDDDNRGFVYGDGATDKIRVNIAVATGLWRVFFSGSYVIK